MAREARIIIGAAHGENNLEVDQRLHAGDRGDVVVVQPQLAQSATVVQSLHRCDAVRKQPQPAERRTSGGDRSEKNRRRF